MNQTLAQNAFPLGYSVSPESEFRDFFNASSSLQTDDLQSFSQRHQSQPLSVPGSGDIRYEPPATITHSFQTTSTVLPSPPDSSYSGSVSTSANSGSSAFPYSTLPNLFPSNVTLTENYSHASSAFLPQPWVDKNMSEYTKSRGPALPPPSLSPQLHYGVTHPSSGPLFGTVRNVGDPYTANYAVNRPDFNHSYSSSHEGVRYGTQYPIPQTHRPSESYQFTNTNGVYHNSSTMPADTSPRPLSTRQEGPPFEETRVLHPVITSRHQQLMPDIVASIQKGFFQVDQKWTCYRRNYFTVSCSFNLRTSYDGQLYLQRNPSHPIEPILQFAVTISAKTAVMNTNQESESRALVQHTPKRDKATESVPGKVALQPAPPASLSSTGALTNNGNLYPSSQQVPSGMLMDYNPNYPSVQHQTSPTSHTFERIQFQKATANNGKRRAQQQYFHIVVKLSAEVGRAGETSHWIEIATKLSNPMVVRGRSPGHYKDNGRRDSTASMDPDRGAGAGGDSGAGLSSMHTLLGSGRSHSSSMDWEPSHRGSNNMGGGYRRAHESEYSPTSTGTADSASDSPTGFSMGRQQVRSVIPTEYERCGPTTQLHGDPFSSIDMQSEVRRLVPRHCASHSAHQQDFGVYGSQQLDMFASPQPQAICP